MKGCYYNNKNCIGEMTGNYKSNDERISWLKSRFSDTIKAAQVTLHGTTSVDNQQIVTIKEDIAKARQQARLALDEVERNVVIEDNLQVMKDFEKLINYNPQRVTPFKSIIKRKKIE